MTSRNDYLDEMFPGRRPIDDATAEDLFAGRTVPSDLEPLATVVRALREVAQQPVPPSAELAARIVAGTAVARPPGRARAPGRLPRIAWRTVAAVPAAVRRASLAAKLAAAGVVVAALGVGSAGFAGSLPDPVQDRFETVVESVVPDRLPWQVREPAPAPPDSGPADHRPAVPPGQEHRPAVPPGQEHRPDVPPGQEHRPDVPPGQQHRPPDHPAPGGGQ